MFSQVYEPKGYEFEYCRRRSSPTSPRISTTRRGSSGSRRRRTRCSTSSTSAPRPRPRTQPARSLVVDNTFATPYLQRPLELGADVVVHSTTKYLGGHSDVVGGFAATNDPTVGERLRFLQKSLGAVPGPFDCWLVLRGIKTLALRMRRHCENATRDRRGARAALARRARPLPRPAAPSRPRDRRAPDARLRRHGLLPRRVARGGGGDSSRATQLFQLAESLGGVESLIEVPARMTHAATADAPFAAPPNLIRLSVGIESADDLVADLENALVPPLARA